MAFESVPSPQDPRNQNPANPASDPSFHPPDEPATEAVPETAVEPEPEYELPPGLRLWRSPDSPTYQPPPGRRAAGARHPQWLIFGTILLGGLLAHSLCVRSVFYSEDWSQIVANDRVDRGQWWEAGLHTLTYLTYWLTYAVAGISAPAFHVGNLLLHLLTALVLAGFARDLLEEGADLPPARSQRLAWWAGLLFAVHPLCSETLNYVRARDIELATLCSLLAAWAALRWRRQRSFKFLWPVLTLTAVLAATLCKEVGFILGAGMALLVGFGVPRSPGAQGYRTPALRLQASPVVTPVKTKLVATPKDAALMMGSWPITLSLALVGLSIAVLAWPAWLAAVHAVQHPLFGWHVLSKARVFWLGMARVLVPIELCSDHQLPWTRSWQDSAAWLAVVAEAAVVVWAGLLYFRRRDPAARTVGVLLALVLLALLHRLGNPGAELMVEYRIYPALAPLCVLLAWGLDRLLASVEQPKTRAVVGWTTVAVLAAAGIVLSAQRALTWNSTQSLTDNVLVQYPMQNRARKELQDADIRAGRWQEVIRRQPELRTAVEQIRAFNAKSPLRSYDTTPLTATHIATEGDCALALAKLGRTQDAEAHLQWAQDSLPAGAILEPASKAALLYQRGRVEEAAGHRERAVECFAESEKLSRHPETIRALRQAKIALLLQQAGRPVP